VITKYLSIHQSNKDNKGNFDSMTSFEISTTINQAVDVIVGALMNPENHPYWTNGLERFEIIKGKAGEVGSMANLHYSQKGRSYIMKDELIFFEPGKKYISRISGEYIVAQVETTLRPHENYTIMELKWSGRGKTLLLKLLLPLLRRKMIRQSKEELETFRNLVETRGADFSSVQQH